MKTNKQNQWLLVLPTDSIQGSEHIVKSLGVYLLSKDINCRVIILTKKKQNGWHSLESNMQITYFPFSSYFFGIAWLIPYLLFSKTNIINYTFTSQTIINGTLGFAKRIGLLKNAKIVLRESNSIFELLSGNKLKVYTFFYKLGYKGSSLVICQTHYMKKQLIKALPKLTQKLCIVTIPNPFNFEDIKNRSETILPEFKNKKFMVAAGRLAHAKGFDILIDTYSNIIKEVPDVDLIILGEGSDRDFLKQKINQLGLKNRVHLPGYVENVYAYFKKSEICILSSRIEGFPNVLPQMMSQNTKVVATLCAGGIDKISGIFTCPPENSERLKESILEALISDTKGNRKVFNTFLESRTQDSFYSEIIKKTT